MTLRTALILGASLFSLLAYNNCGSSGFNVEAPVFVSSIASGVSAPLQVNSTDNNVVPITVGCGYINQPCVSVQICEPGTSNCQTIDRILLDTGSYGLRVFSSVINVNLTQKKSGNYDLAECVSYADGSSNWGPVKIADVGLGGMKASKVAIQVINKNYASIPNDCTDPDESPTSAGFNGILGVGLFTEDCGSGCAKIADNRIYFACDSSVCSGTTVAVKDQVSNPVAYLPSNNNGVILQMPSIPSSGSGSATGYMILGIGNQANNTPETANVFPADSSGHFRTTFNGTTYNDSIIDSGSNGLFFPGPANLTECSSNSVANGFYCPSSTMTFSATQAGSSGSPRIIFNFEIANAVTAVGSSNRMFNNIGGHFDSVFYWGMPFYFGRTVYHGIEGKYSPLGVGPYWAW